MARRSYSGGAVPRLTVKGVALWSVIIAGGVMLANFLMKWGEANDVPILTQAATGEVGSSGWFGLGIGPF